MINSEFPVITQNDRWAIEQSLHGAGIDPDSIATILGHLPRIVDVLLDLGYVAPDAESDL